MTPVVADKHCNNDKLINALVTYFIFSILMHYAWSCCLPWLLPGCDTLMSSITYLCPTEGVSGGIVAWW